MLSWLFPSFVALSVAVVLTVAADEHMSCTKETSHQPGVCNCTAKNNKCFIKFTIIRSGDNEENYKYLINNERIGPTIIVDHETIVVVDVYNLNPDAVSIHWHGMHQRRAQFMDGVGNITQVAIKYGETFRYVFSATPAGTHWYHSHMGDQRDKGFLGALIVLEKNFSDEFPDVQDLPENHTIAIQDSMTKVNNSDPACDSDGSVLPDSKFDIKKWLINGIELDTIKPMVAKIDNNLEPIFLVTRGQQYRFRIIGAMKATVLRMSIDGHELEVISSDGYLTEPFKTDLLIIHVGERYDIRVIPKDGCDASYDVFPIRIESVEVHCSDYSVPERTGYAYLKYVQDIDDSNTENLPVFQDDNRCRNDVSCIALNCPFEAYPNEHHRTNILCKPVTELKLRQNTSETDLPKNVSVEEYFFNFDFPNVKGSKAMVNGVQFILPSKFPFVNPKRKIPNEKCHYECIDRGFTEPDIYLCKTCSHTVRISANYTGGELKPKTIRFVLSSLPSKDETNNITDVRTHPIHLHGHSFFVREIAYPNYTANNTINNVNKDLARSNCGPLSWNVTKDFPALPKDTIRKDVVIVPAGGYVVIEFLADNPGWWFMHCHIDFHLIAGMAIAVNELPECQNDPPPHDEIFKPNETYDDAVTQFEEFREKNTCNIPLMLTPTPNPTPKEQVFADETEKQAIEREVERNSDEINLHNMRQKTFNPDVNMNRDDQFASPYYKRLLHERFRDRGTDPEQHRFQDIRQRNEHAPEWNK